MKRRALIVFVTLAVAVMTTGCNKHPLESRIVRYAERNHTGEYLEINLADFTDFEWDRAVVYAHPVTKAEIEEALGIECDILFDLQSGIIFAHNGKVMYDEVFKQKYRGIDPVVASFLMHHNQDVNKTPRFRVLTPQDAIFELRKNEFGPSEHYNYHRLYPKD
ncbi:MAG: hypothetical protein FWG78_01335 [Coriobacteriia bacterium]|nr:hypothetical protein [Coriobacteriia bacterium]